MSKYRRERAVTEFEANTGSVSARGLSQAGAARRTFLGRIGRWSAALAVFGWGPEALMRAVAGRSIVPSAVAAGAPRNRQLHPFPSDDSFNMPLGVNAWYAPISDPATSQMVNNSFNLTANNGWSHPIFMPSVSDPIHTFNHANFQAGTAQSIESYRQEENGQRTLQERLQSSAEPSIPAGGGQWSGDRHLHIVYENELIEFWLFYRKTSTTADAYRIVRNRLDHYAHAGGSNPLRNRAGTRAWGGSAIAGLIRKHEIDTASPHIPHALAIAGDMWTQMGSNQQPAPGKIADGDPSSPVHNVRQMFPASDTDWGGYCQGSQGRSNCNGSWRMGMRFAFDPTRTDAWINANAPNIYVAAVARALRDYGCIVCDGTSSTNQLYAEEGISASVEMALINHISWVRTHMRRVAGAGPVHNPLESHWDSWRANGQGWGGGAPRVPYSPPLSPAGPPQAPVGIEVTEAPGFGDTA